MRFVQAQGVKNVEKCFCYYGELKNDCLKICDQYDSVGVYKPLKKGEFACHYKRFR